MKKIFLCLIALMMLSTVAMAANLDLSWIPSTERCDGSAFTGVTTHSVYWGSISRPMSDPDLCGTETFQYDNLLVVPGTETGISIDVGDSEFERVYYMAVTTMGFSGESMYSNEVMLIVPPTQAPIPSPPSLTAVVR